jgi:hypothetical protein
MYEYELSVNHNESDLTYLSSRKAIRIFLPPAEEQQGLGDDGLNVQALH